MEKLFTLYLCMHCLTGEELHTVYSSVITKLGKYFVPILYKVKYILLLHVYFYIEIDGTLKWNKGKEGVVRFCHHDLSCLME